MLQSNQRKHHIDLKDYPYQRDVGIRLFLSKLTDIEKQLLEEITNGSLKCSIKQIISAVETDHSEISSLLNRLKDLDLFKIQGDALLVNKEMRKYFACELEKFSPNFDPCLLYLQSILNKVPIHNLPTWYAISRTSDNIFSSILEKYFQTPKLYYKHLEELSVERPDLFKIYKMILETPQLVLDGNTVIKDFKLSQEEFVTLMLEFEYNLCGCICYQKIGNSWHECVTFYSEWKQFLMSNRFSHSSIDEEEVKKISNSDFGFIEKFAEFLEKRCDSLFHIENKINPNEDALLLNTALELQLFSLENKQLIPSKRHLQVWTRKTKQEQANVLYQHILGYARVSPDKVGNCTERELREIEKGLKVISQHGWILFDDFIARFKGAIRNHSPIELQPKGKKWRYKLPEYDENDKKLIREIIEEHFWKAGLVKIGSFQNKFCFCITPYGRMTLGD